MTKARVASVPNPAFSFRIFQAGIGHKLRGVFHRRNQGAFRIMLSRLGLLELHGRT